MGIEAAGFQPSGTQPPSGPFGPAPARPSSAAGSRPRPAVRAGARPFPRPGGSPALSPARRGAVLKSSAAAMAPPMAPIRTTSTSLLVKSRNRLLGIPRTAGRVGRLAEVTLRPDGSFERQPGRRSDDHPAGPRAGAQEHLIEVDRRASIRGRHNLRVKPSQRSAGAVQCLHSHGYRPARRGTGRPAVDA